MYVHTHVQVEVVVSDDWKLSHVRHGGMMQSNPAFFSRKILHEKRVQGGSTAVGLDWSINSNANKESGTIPLTRVLQLDVLGMHMLETAVQTLAKFARRVTGNRASGNRSRGSRVARLCVDAALV